MSKMNRPEDQDTNLAEEVLRQGGKSKEEVERIGQLDRGDDLVERTFDAKFRTVNSPVHKAVWSGKTPVNLFRRQSASAGTTSSVDYKAKMNAAVAVVKSHREAGTLFGSDNKVTDQVIAELSATGYWGALIASEFGGWGAPVAEFMSFLTRMAAEGDPTVAGMASIHGCIGAVDPVEAYGSPELQAEYLPKLASGERLSGFALTEPWAGSDLTALRTTAVLDGDDYVVNGRKLFISNVIPGRTLGLVVLISGKPAVLIADLPDAENDHFQLDRYGIHAVQHVHNYGIVFKDFRVPAKNLLVPPVGDGLTIAYHGLNRGRVALCANAAGTMRLLLKSMLPWVVFRETYGDEIGKRELVQRRVARLASLIVGADALVNWGSSLLDEGYRGELECIVAKIFGADALAETATNLALKTHGGRTFLHGHVIGDNIHDFLAPSIYEGENEMLGMALFKGLVKDHGMKYMAPFATVKGFNPMNPAHLWKLKGACLRLGFYTVRAMFSRFDSQNIKGLNPKLSKHAKFVLKSFRKLMRETHFAMLTHQLKLADRQQRMIELSGDVQKTVVILAVCMHASELGDEATVLAADVLSRELSRQIKGGRASDADFRVNVKLAKLVADGKFKQIEAAADSPILRSYQKQVQR